MTMENDPKGYLWISTSNGVCRFNLKKKRFASYGQKDGFIPFANFGTSSATLNNGEILFSGSNMLVTFPPDMYNNTKSPPAVRLTDIRVLDQYISVDSILNIRKASFAGDNNSLTIYFSAMSYFLQDKLTYYYRLSGVDNDWINGGNNASAAYTLLPPGKYVFEVKCENEEGLSSPVTSFHFSIRPPFWQTWWFVITVALIVAAFLFYLHRLRVNKILALSELRSRVARDLHDDVGSTLSTISILSTMAKTRLNEDSAVAGEYIGKISDNSQQMMEAMDDIVWSIKPMNDSMQKIIARMREVASGSLEPKNIDIDFYVDEKVFDLKLNMEARRDLFLIFKEAINNIAKYSGSSHVLIHISYLRKRLMLKIRDNGIGFDINKADNGNGLSNMKKRAAMLNARIKMYSDKQQGTQILLNIPIN
jgi:two-component sensor histidine kinase